MSHASELSGLSFFTVSHYSYTQTGVCNFLDSPRANYCMGLVLEGKGVFTFGGKQVVVEPGEVIFVPVGSRYRSDWQGDPAVDYISMHFFFTAHPPFLYERHLDIQKVAPAFLDEFRSLFKEALAAYEGDISGQLTALGCFYRVMGILLPRLEYGLPCTRNVRVEEAAAYMDSHFREVIPVETLSSLCHMSSSHFHTCFKSAYGMTPIEYKNRVCIRYAIMELLRGKMSVEELSRELGFSSSAYFRRVFRHVTGCAPTEYVQKHMGM